MRKVIFVILAVVVGLLFVEIAATSLDDATTDTITEVVSVTSDAAGAGTLALTNVNYYTDRTNMTVTGATDGALNNASTTIDAARTGITFLAGALTVSATQDVTVVHRTEGDDDAVGIIQIVPFLFVMGIMTTTVFGAFQGVQAARGKTAGLDITSFIVVLVGLILIGTITSFVASTTATYAVRPEYTGVGAVLPLVTIGYVIGLVGQLVGTGIGRARGGLS